MDEAAVLTDAFERVHGVTQRVLAGLGPAALAYRPDVGANSIAWLIWHLTRIQDDHVAHVAGTEQVWTAGGWYERCALGFDAGATGYGHTADDVAAVRVDASLLAGYHDAVHRRTLEFVRGVGSDDLDRVVDRSYDPPVTLGVRLVSVIADNLQHAGQAAYVRGLFERAA